MTKPKKYREWFNVREISCIDGTGSIVKSGKVLNVIDARAFLESQSTIGDLISEIQSLKLQADNLAEALDFYVVNVYNENHRAMPECFKKAEQALKEYRDNNE